MSAESRSLAQQPRCLEQQTSVARRLLRLALRHRASIAGAALAAAGLSAARLYLTWLIKTWADAIDDPSSLELSRLLVPAVLASLGMIVCIHLSRYLPARVDQRIIEDLRNRAVARLLRAHPRSLSAFASGELVSRVQTDAGALDGITLQAIKQLVSPTLVLLGSIAFMISLDWRLAIAVLLGVPLAAAALAAVGGAIQGASRSAQQQAGRLSARLVEQVQGLVTIHTLGTADDERRLFREHTAAYRRHQLRGAQWSAVLVATIWAVATAALVLALWLGSRRIAAGQLTPGGLLAFCLFAGQAVDALRNLGVFQARLAQLTPAAERVFEVVDLPLEGTTPRFDSVGASSSSPAPPDPAGAADAADADGLHGPLVLDRVSFSYPEDDRQILHQLSLRVEPAETVAIVGATGTGKSTLARLLTALHRPTAGSIHWAGRELGTIPTQLLYRSLAVVPQEPFLFARSLRENLTYGSPDADPDRLAWAIEAAELGSLVAAAPGGLETPVHELGTSLSGGQRQRMVLARALLREPSLLVLDEATSALDSDTESAIWSRLQPWLARRTVIVFAHRLATVQRVPRIVVLEDGRVLTDGRTEDVLRDDAGFRRLFGEQLTLAGRGVA